MQVEVKAVKECDLNLVDKLTKIEAEAFGEGGLNTWGLVPMIHYGAVFVLFVEEDPVGLIEYMRSFDQPDLVYLYGLAIAKEYRGEALGKELLATSLEKIKDKAKEIVLTVNPENEVAIKLYQSFGFEKTDFNKAEYGIGEDRIIMTLKC